MVFHGHGYNVVGDREHSILRSKEQYIFSKIFCLFVLAALSKSLVIIFHSRTIVKSVVMFSMVLVVILCIGDGCSSAHSV